MKQIVVVLFLLAVFAPLAATSEELRLEASVEAMGSTYSLVLYGEDRSRLEAASEDAFEEARRLDRMLSNYRPESEWSDVNRHAAERPVKVSAELFQLLSACVEYSRQSEGAFDISVGPLMKIWGFYKGSGHLPHRAEVRGVLAKVGYRNILLDAANRTVRFSREGVELDPGGIGKGYAVDRMVDILRRDGIVSALVRCHRGRETTRRLVCGAACRHRNVWRRLEPGQLVERCYGGGRQRRGRHAAGIAHGAELLA